VKRRDTALSQALLALAMWLTAPCARAATLVPMSIEDLARGSVAAIVGTIDDLTSVRAADGGLYTLVTVSVEQTLMGHVPAPTIVLKENGGTIDGVSEIVVGAPSFAVGEEVLLFLTARPDGSLRTTQLALGKFDLVLDLAGMPRATQRITPDTTVLLPPGVTAPGESMPLSDVLDAITRAGSGGGGTTATPLLAQPPEATDGSLARAFVPYFVLQDSRFFEPDEGKALSFFVDNAGDALLGRATSRAAVDAGFAAWTNVATATITLQDGGLTSDTNLPCPGANKIVFNDPAGRIDPPVNCHGTLALGFYCRTTAEAKVLGGRSFDRILNGYVIFANGWNGCDVWTATNLAEIATHEVGHAIGMAHSSEDPNEATFTLKDATMYFLAHFDGRGASVHSDDIGGISALYPTAIPLTITTPDPLPNATQGLAYNQALTTIGGTSAFTWSLAGGGVPGLDLSQDGVIFGTPTAAGSTFFKITAAELTGDTSHTKVLHITVNTPLPSLTPTITKTPTTTATPTITATFTTTATVTITPTPTITPSTTPAETALPTDSPTMSPTPTDSPSPSPSATIPPTGTATAIPTPTPTTPSGCVGDCDGSGDVTVNDLLVLVNIALGNAGTAACPSGDTSHDGAITVDEILAAVNAALSGCA